MSAERFVVRPNILGRGYHVIDTTTNKQVPWAYDQECGYKNEEQDEKRAHKFADLLNDLHKRLCNVG